MPSVDTTEFVLPHCPLLREEIVLLLVNAKLDLPVPLENVPLHLLLLDANKPSIVQMLETWEFACVTEMEPKVAVEVESYPHLFLLNVLVTTTNSLLVLINSNASWEILVLLAAWREIVLNLTTVERHVFCKLWLLQNSFPPIASLLPTSAVEFL